jgi:very-short-patch-repair endonuclease
VVGEITVSIHGKTMSGLEEELLFQIRAVGLPIPEREFRFHKERKFLFDFAYPINKIAIEVDGGTYGFKCKKTGKFIYSGRHTRGKGFYNDCIKMNLATIDGWKVLRGDSKMVKDGTLIKHIEDLFASLQ